MDSKKVRLRSLNAHITCYICKGYFVDATTVIDCLHTFCKSCLLKHFQQNKCCPKCESLIHQSHPSHYVSVDRTMQDLVFKLVPKMNENETLRREEFYSENSIPYDGAMTESAQNESSNKDTDDHRADEQISVHLRCEGASPSVKSLKRPYIRCSAYITVTQIKKYLAQKLHFDMLRFKDLDILCNDELMGKDHTLKFIQRTRWRTQTMPMELYYRKHIDF